MNKNLPRGCISCTHAHHDRIAGAMFCRRYPRVVVVSIQTGDNYGKVFSHFPAVEPTDICGEYNKSDKLMVATRETAQ